MTERNEETRKVLDKVRKLFALAGSSNEAEALAASEKAHALLREYNLSASDIQDEKEIKSEYLGEYRRERKWRAIILSGVCRLNYCAVLTQICGGKTRQKIYGREYNVAGSIAMFEYLVQAVDRISRFANTGNRNSFRLGMAIRLHERLEELAQEESTCTALVPVSAEAMKALREENQGLKDCYIKPTGDELAIAQGRRAANSVPLNGQVGRARAEAVLV